MNELRLCSNCKYAKVSPTIQPCTECVGTMDKPNWLPKEQPTINMIQPKMMVTTDQVIKMGDYIIATDYSDEPDETVYIQFKRVKGKIHILSFEVVERGGN